MKRTIIINGVIYGDDIGKILVSVGVLNGWLRLHFEWTSVDPLLILEDGHDRWELFRGGGVDGEGRARNKRGRGNANMSEENACVWRV